MTLSRDSYVHYEANCPISTGIELSLSLEINLRFPKLILEMMQCAGNIIKFFSNFTVRINQRSESKADSEEINSNDTHLLLLTKLVA